MDPRQAQVGIDVNKLEIIPCSKCNLTDFIQTVQFRFLPKIVSPTGQEGVVNVGKFYCSNCGHPFEESQTDFMKFKEAKIISPYNTKK